jgi:hypothetical protein
VAHNELRKSEVKDHAEHAARQASPWLGRLTRLGYVAEGAVYVAP